MSFVDPRSQFASKDFSGGYLDTPEPDSLPQSASPSAKNCLLISVQRSEDIGAARAVLRKRLGTRLVNPTAMTSSKTVDGLFEFQREGATSELLAVCNGLLKKFDNVDTFNAVTAGSGFTVGNPTRMLAFRNNAFVSDGVQNLRYNGTQCWTVGFIAPTAAPAIAVVAGPGVTGTYEGYAVWYDSVMDHESSPSAVTAATAFANQQRQWTKPAGAPPANVDFWRIYCRRTDTNERNYFRCASVAIATANVTESVSDGARTELGPNPSDNDVPPAFALQEEFKGFRLGVKTNSSDLYVSKQYDAESQHPKNVFPIGGKGDSKPLRCVKKFGEECLLQKPRRTYRIVGDRLPFQFVPVHSSLGNVSQEAGIEVRGWFYAYDEIVGPYRTDLSRWQPLADNRIVTTITSVNRQNLDQIRAEHVPLYNLIIWAVPTTTSRKRTLLAYNYVLDAWLPPITGFEYSSLSQFTTTDGQLGVYSATTGVACISCSTAKSTGRRPAARAARSPAPPQGRSPVPRPRSTRPAVVSPGCRRPSRVPPACGSGCASNRTPERPSRSIRRTDRRSTRSHSQTARGPSTLARSSGTGTRRRLTMGRSSGASSDGG
jgi:hypothetical protein